MARKAAPNQSSKPELRDGRLKTVRVKGKPFIDRNREKAARLIAEGHKTYTAIAQEVEKSLGWLMEQKRKPEFIERVIELQEIYAKRMINYGIANKQHRVRVLNEMHDDLQQIARNREEELKDRIPGGNPGGLLVIQKKAVGMMTVEEVKIDTGLTTELRNTQEQVARELGQLSAKHEFSVDDPLSQLLDEFRKEHESVEPATEPEAE